MNHERPAPEEVLQRQHQRQNEDTRERNGTGEDADEEQLGVTKEEIDDLEDDAKGG